MHQDTIAISAPQLYRSVIPFLPTSTILSKVYCQQADGCVQVIQGLDSGWPAHHAVLKGIALSDRTIIFSPNSTLLACTMLDHTIRVWNGVTGVALFSLRHWPDLVSGTMGTIAIVFSQDGTRLTSASSDAVCLWDAITGTLIIRITSSYLLFKYKSFPNNLLSPDSQRIVLVLRESSRAGRICLWDWVSGFLL